MLRNFMKNILGMNWRNEMTQKNLFNHLLYTGIIIFLILGMNVQDAMADKYIKIPPGGNYNYGSVSNLQNATISDDDFANFNRDSSTDGNHAIGNNDFANGYTEGTHGYISEVTKFGMEYHLFPNAFNDDYMEGWFSTNGGRSWNGAWFPSSERPIVDNTAVINHNDASVVDKDIHYTKTFTTDQGRINRWGEINGDYWRYGLWCDLCWYHKPQRWNADNTTVYIDYIYINVLVKLTVTGTDKTPATATQGSEDVPILQLNFKPYSNSSFDISKIRVDIKGNCSADDVDLIKFYKDTDSSGTVTAGDILMGSVDPGTTKDNRDINFSPVIDDVPHNSKWLFAVNIKNTATVGRTIGLELDNQGDITPTHAIDEVASDSDRSNAGTAGNPDPNDFWPIQSGFATIKQKATLTASVTTIPSSGTVLMGNNITVRMNVSNANNCESAVNVLPNALIVGGTGTAVTSNFQLPQTIAGGSSHTFEWTYQAVTPGTVIFSGTASGEDAYSGKTQTSNSNSSNTLTIAYKASTPILQVTSFTATPTSVSNDSQTVDVSISVKNVGNTTANNSYIGHYTTGTAWSFKETANPVKLTNVSAANSMRNIAVGATETWNFSFEATGSAGTTQLQVSATGDSVTNPAYSSSQLITINSKALVQNVSISTSPTGDIGKNATFVVAMIVKNNGGSIAENVTPREPVVNESTNGDPNPVKKGGPFPAESVTLNPGESYKFSWSFYSKGGTIINGRYTISVTTDYDDKNSGNTRNTGAQTSALFRITNTVTPISQKSTTGDVRKLIAYTYDSQYYVVNESSRLYAYDTLGAEKWNVNLATWFTVPGHTIVVTVENGKNVIWVGSHNGRVYAIQDNGGSAGGFYSSSIGNSWLSLGTGDPVENGPIVYGEHVYCSGKYHFAKRMKADGTIPSGWVDKELPNDITTSASIDNLNIYLGCADGRLYCLDVESGFLRRRSSDYGSAIEVSPFIYANVITTGNNDGELLKFNSANNISTNVTVQDLNGGSTNDLSELWIGLSGDFIWVTDETGGNLYKVNYNNISSFTTKSIGGTLYGPIEYAGKVYVCSVTGGGQGEVQVLSKTTLNSIDAALWPYQVPGNAFRTPVSLDPWNNVFLTGSDDNNIYMFSLPE